MRRARAFIATVAAAGVLAGCEFGVLDNYDPPSSSLTGQVVYEDQPVGVASDGVQLELWQEGYATPEKIPIYVDQDGSFSAVLFDGNYSLTTLAGNGPWTDTADTVHIQLHGEADVDVPVTPYYTISAETVTSDGGAIDATFQIGQVDGSRAVEYVGLYVSTTSFVDRTNQASRIEKDGGDIATFAEPVHLSLPLSDDLAQRQHVYARIGVKTVGVAELLYSPVYEVAP